MGAQDIYRLAGVVTYSYAPKSSSPQRREGQELLTDPFLGGWKH